MNPRRELVNLLLKEVACNPETERLEWIKPRSGLERLFQVMEGLEPVGRRRFRISGKVENISCEEDETRSTVALVSRNENRSTNVQRPTPGPFSQSRVTRRPKKLVTQSGDDGIRTRDLCLDRAAC